MILALALLISAEAPDLVEQELSARCDIETPSLAMMTYAGDRWTVHYDDQLSAEREECLIAWATTYPVANAIIPERTTRDRRERLLRYRGNVDLELTRQWHDLVEAVRRQRNPRP